MSRAAAQCLPGFVQWGRKQSACIRQEKGPTEAAHIGSLRPSAVQKARGATTGASTAANKSSTSFGTTRWSVLRWSRLCGGGSRASAWALRGSHQWPLALRDGIAVPTETRARFRHRAKPRRCGRRVGRCPVEVGGLCVADPFTTCTQEISRRRGVLLRERARWQSVPKERNA